MKTQKELAGMKRGSTRNQLRALRKGFFKKPPNHSMHGLTKENWQRWFRENIKHLGNFRYTYQIYSNLQTNDGIFQMPNDVDKEIQLAVLSDWSSDTKESREVATLVGKRDYSLHLGDTYYVGDSPELAGNFNEKFGGPWPYGKLRNFALLRNHEMYSSGESYFTEPLP